MINLMIALQYPVVVLLIVLSLQASRAFHSTAFRLIASGWIFNLAYLLSQDQFHSLFQTIVPVADHLIENSFDILCSVAFLLGARQLDHLHSRSLLRQFSDRTLAIASIAALGTHVVIYSTLPSLIALAATISVVLAMLGILALSRFFQAIQKTLVGNTRSFQFLFLATLSYALLQPLYFPSILLPQWHEAITKFGFATGFLLKFAILLGLMNLFIAASGRSREESARVEEARSVVARVAHELGTPV